MVAFDRDDLCDMVRGRNLHGLLAHRLRKRDPRSDCGSLWSRALPYSGGSSFREIFHNSNYQTLVDYFDHRYGRWAAGLLSVLYIPVYIGWVGAQLLALGSS